MNGYPSGTPGLAHHLFLGVSYSIAVLVATTYHHLCRCEILYLPKIPNTLKLTRTALHSKRAKLSLGSGVAVNIRIGSYGIKVFCSALQCCAHSYRSGVEEAYDLGQSTYAGHGKSLRWLGLAQIRYSCK